MSAKALRKCLVGLESTAGASAIVDTALKATCNLSVKVDKVQVQEDIGSFAQPRHYIGSIHAEGSIKQDGIYEQAPYLTSMALGQATPSASAPYYGWNFPLPHSASTTFATYTVEYTDGNNWHVRAADVFAKSLQISGKAGKSWEFTADVVGANTSYPSATSASTVASGSVNTIRMGDTRLYIDTAYSAIGSASVGGVLINFDYKLDGINHQKMFADGQLYPTGRGNDRYTTTMTFTLEADNSNVRTLRDKVLNTTGTAVRVQATSGCNIARIDGWYMVESVDSLDDRDGNNIVAVTLKGEKDGSDNTGTIYYTCELAAL